VEFKAKVRLTVELKGKRAAEQIMQELEVLREIHSREHLNSQ
jgi:hypothetical protein